MIELSIFFIFRMLLPPIIMVILTPLILFWPGDPGESYWRKVCNRYRDIASLRK